jgi:hypothetical protein
MSTTQSKAPYTRVAQRKPSCHHPEPGAMQSLGCVHLIQLTRGLKGVEKDFNLKFLVGSLPAKEYNINPSETSGIEPWMDSLPKQVLPTSSQKD